MKKIPLNSLNIEKTSRKEFISEIYKKKKDKFKLYRDSTLLTGRDIRDWLNYNANIFSLGENAFLSGIYNTKTMELINSIKRTKQQVNDVLYSLSLNSADTDETLKQLLAHLKKNSEPNPLDFVSPDFENFNNMRNFYSNMYLAAADDLLVQYIGFDKIESAWPRTITTSKQNIYEEYYNYIIFDYNIVQIPKLYFDKDEQKFRWIYPNEQVNLGLNRELEKEAQLVKKYIPYEQRYKYILD